MNNTSTNSTSTGNTSTSNTAETDVCDRADRFSVRGPIGFLRTRWAAIGAAVAVSLGAGGIGLAHATVDSGDRPILVDINPCRLTDTRSDSQVGPRGTPLGAGEQYAVAAHGVNGNCNIPAEATALSLNVTALNATAPTFVTVFPTDEAQPLTSNLNLVPGQSPTPNAVTTGLDAAGMFTLYNAHGSTDLIVDVNGYYEHHNHDDRYVQQSEMLWAVVDTDGDLERSSGGVVSAERLDGGLPTGDYAVVFERDISDCAYQATVGRPVVSSGPAIGFALVANWTDDPEHGVIVFTKDQNGAGADRGFHLLVTC
jgi:hypothetical protein